MNSVAIIGEHPAFRLVLELARKAAPADSTVLIAGETGTGKKLLARYIHDQSRRATRPLIAVNCGAMSPELLESDLFGHADRDPHQSRFRAGDGGTVLLDQVDELPSLVQARLQAFLQHREIRAVGSVEATTVDIRLIAVASRDIAQLVEEGRFRRDLYYQLKVLSLRIPPLRERRSDIPFLAQYFLDAHKRLREPQSPYRLSGEAMTQLWQYDWPGNVRELQSAIEQCVVFSRADLIDVPDLPPEIRAFHPSRNAPMPTIGADGIDFDSLVAEFEAKLIDEALRRTKGNKQAAAQLLGLKRTTLVAKLRRRSAGAAESDIRVGGRSWD
jgi:DNA-binding NtrC family response regulator